MKRFISAVAITVLAGMLLSTRVFASAPKADAKLVMKSTVSVPKLDVTLPTNAGFLINPYKLKIGVTPDGEGVTSSVVALYGTYGKVVDYDDNSWKIINHSSDVAVKGMIYATYYSSKMVQVNPQSSDINVKKKQLMLKLELDGVDVPLLEAKPADWQSDGVVEFDLGKNLGTDDSNIAELVLTGNVNSNGLTWTNSDKCNITMGFKFEILSN